MPTWSELELGAPALEMLLDAFPDAKVIALGRKSEELLETLDMLPNGHLRHPPYGGASSRKACAGWSRTDAPGSRSGRLPHSAGMPAALITLLHLARSDLINAAYSCGVPPWISMPAASSLALTSGILSAALISLLSRVMIGLGVPAGARNPPFVLA